MEMIDVLKKLQELASKSPEVAKATEQVEKMNPKEVDENAIQSETSIVDETPESGEYPVYAMTAKDEILFKTPDALLNGQATVDVIQSCMPNVKDAWKAPSIDMDAMLVAIRMASYGELLPMKGMIPGTDIEKDFDLN